MPRPMLATWLLLPLVCGCDDFASEPPPDEATRGARLPAGSEVVVKALHGQAKLRGLVEDATKPDSPRGRGTVPDGTRAVVVDDSLADLFPNVPGSRDVAVKLEGGGAE